jgi:hypothetical protein
MSELSYLIGQPLWVCWRAGFGWGEIHSLMTESEVFCIECAQYVRVEEKQWFFFFLRLRISDNLQKVFSTVPGIYVYSTLQVT